MTFLLLPAKMTHHLMFNAELQDITHHTPYRHLVTVLLTSTIFHYCFSRSYAKLENNDGYNIFYSVCTAFNLLKNSYSYIFKIQIKDVLSLIVLEEEKGLLSFKLCINELMHCKWCMLYCTFDVLIDLMRWFFS